MDGWGREGMEVKSFRVKEFGRAICNKLGSSHSQRCAGLSPKILTSTDEEGQAERAFLVGSTCPHYTY